MKKKWKRYAGYCRRIVVADDETNSYFMWEANLLSSDDIFSLKTSPERLLLLVRIHRA